MDSLEAGPVSGPGEREMERGACRGTGKAKAPKVVGSASSGLAIHWVVATLALELRSAGLLRG